MTFFENYQSEFIASLFVLIFLFIIRVISHKLIYKLGKKSGINDARIHLISRYATVTLILIALLIETFILAARLKVWHCFFFQVFAIFELACFPLGSI